MSMVTEGRTEEGRLSWIDFPRERINPWEVITELEVKLAMSRERGSPVTLSQDLTESTLKLLEHFVGRWYRVEEGIAAQKIVDEFAD